jgi:putative CGCGG family rSAM target protein
LIEETNIFGPEALTVAGGYPNVHMATQSPDHESAEPVTDRVHDNSWSANLEQPDHAEDRSLVVEQALSAIEHTAAGNHVNLVTHSAHGHPETYLYEALEASDENLEWEYVQQCGCGGHLTSSHG